MISVCGKLLARECDEDVHAGGETVQLRRLTVHGDLGRGRDFEFFALMRRENTDRDRGEMNGGDLVGRVG